MDNKEQIHYAINNISYFFVCIYLKVYWVNERLNVEKKNHIFMEFRIFIFWIYDIEDHRDGSRHFRTQVIWKHPNKIGEGSGLPQNLTIVEK